MRVDAACLDQTAARPNVRRPRQAEDRHQPEEHSWLPASDQQVSLVGETQRPSLMPPSIGRGRSRGRAAWRRPAVRRKGRHPGRGMARALVRFLPSGGLIRGQLKPLVARSRSSPRAPRPRDTWVDSRTTPQQPIKSGPQFLAASAGHTDRTANGVARPQGDRREEPCSWHYIGSIKRPGAWQWR